MNINGISMYNSKLANKIVITLHSLAVYVTHVVIKWSLGTANSLRKSVQNDKKHDFERSIVNSWISFKTTSFSSSTYKVCVVLVERSSWFYSQCEGIQHIELPTPPPSVMTSNHDNCIYIIYSRNKMIDIVNPDGVKSAGPPQREWFYIRHWTMKFDCIHIHLFYYDLRRN